MLLLSAITLFLCAFSHLSNPNVCSWIFCIHVWLKFKIGDKIIISSNGNFKHLFLFDGEKGFSLDQLNESKCLSMFGTELFPFNF